LRAGGSPINPTIARLLLNHVRHADATRQTKRRPTGALALSERETEILRMVAKV
jgi:DNA-binding NarL/FixJ family response regulator